MNKDIVIHRLAALDDSRLIATTPTSEFWG